MNDCFNWGVSPQNWYVVQNQHMCRIKTIPLLCKSLDKGLRAMPKLYFEILEISKAITTCNPCTYWKFEINNIKNIIIGITKGPQAISIMSKI